VSRAGRHLSILLVDDEDIVRTGTAEMLRELGHSVREAAGSADALKLLSSGDPVDALVTDYMMPQMNGAELARRVRMAYPGIAVLVITGYAGGDIDLGLPKIAKPFRQADLAAALQALFERKDNVVRLPSHRR
jgi:CheY-like chemotaxis protein